MGLKTEFSNGEKIEGFYIFELKNGEITGIPVIHLTSFHLEAGSFLIKFSSIKVRISGNNLKALFLFFPSGFHLKEDSERFKDSGRNEDIWVSKIEIEELDTEELPGGF
tara:strand:+ start:102 stop:428 length:327 start_codon:yes stop_codon:yes gene_type:complete